MMAMRIDPDTLQLLDCNSNDIASLAYFAISVSRGHNPGRPLWYQEWLMAYNKRTNPRTLPKVDPLSGNPLYKTSCIFPYHPLLLGRIAEALAYRLLPDNAVADTRCDGMLKPR